MSYLDNIYYFDSEDKSYSFGNIWQFLNRLGGSRVLERHAYILETVDNLYLYMLMT